ncbi:unnamed protein product, partial [Symbiodinium pilosum]
MTTFPLVAASELPHENVDRSLREVYIGGLSWASADKDVVIPALEAAFQELEDYRNRYKDVKSPIINVHIPPALPFKRSKTQSSSTFVFVEFYDRLLARTALQLSGLRIGDRSARICPPSAGVDLAGSGLDVEPLRCSEAIPYCAGPGAQLHCNVWLGNIPARLGRKEQQKMLIAAPDAEVEKDGFVQQIDDAILALPGVRIRYPNLARAIHAFRFSDCGRFGFLE